MLFNHFTSAYDPSSIFKSEKDFFADMMRSAGSSEQEPEAATIPTMAAETQLLNMPEIHFSTPSIHFV